MTTDPLPLWLLAWAWGLLLAATFCGGGFVVWLILFRIFVVRK